MKAKKIATQVFKWLVGLMVIASGIFKLTGSEQVMAVLNNIGMTEYRILLAMMEIIFAILFLYTKTMKLGFALLTAYFAGAIATELSHDGPFINAMMILIFVWIATYVRDKTTFVTN